ncbi:N6-adenine-specific methylase [Ignavibacterium album JCM 16511]|uniref:N6-adenine-specific methylase n=1 Tax=Ignavibacterium album (strain DSM 19864 / JCM 16511 / NBRC 101810 / Mat9-16) TaxID=945713 RepID=I0AII9_IGNAJ|nr:16S rRNA (guanine(966)-N(2))-methyltransferase RsmD [Ignavibacterium album]AFH48796.1 N6-adenine-specific methylase [Ignavibacterium album JCM 16511]
MRMRIISGYLKGRFFNVPQSKFIRPTTDRVRETLFNILNNLIDFEGIEVLDLYSGSGSLGFECISRGAKSVLFVEKNNMIYKNLTENIKSLEIEDKCSVVRSEAIVFTRKKSIKSFDLILADPPFFEYDIYNVVENLKQNGYMDKESMLIIERSIQTKEKDIENFKVEPFRIIGDACLYKITI